jgi:hypothetical protein
MEDGEFKTSLVYIGAPNQRGLHSETLPHKKRGEREREREREKERERESKEDGKGLEKKRKRE